MLLTIISILITLGVVVFVHELGHFWFAKRNGIKVLTFALGFGPKLFGVEYKGTLYVLRAIPIGGYVKMAGEVVDEITGNPDEYWSKPWYQRIQVVLAGPIMNYIFSILLFTSIFTIIGLPQPPEQPVIGEMVAGMPAELAGLKSGDKIMQIDNVKIEKWDQAAAYIHSHGDKDIAIIIERENSQIEFNIVPKFDKAQNIGLIGITPKVVYKKTDIFTAFIRGVQQVIYITVITLKTLFLAIIKLAKPDIAGPIGIAQFASKTAKSGIYDFLLFLSVVSTGLGLFNLLPIPIADGGYVIIFLYEGITKKKVTIKQLEIINTIGIFIFLFIFFLAMYNDIERLVIQWKSKLKPKVETIQQPPAPAVQQKR